MVLDGARTGALDLLFSLAFVTKARTQSLCSSSISTTLPLVGVLLPYSPLSYHVLKAPACAGRGLLCPLGCELLPALSLLKPVLAVSWRSASSCLPLRL